MDRNAERQMVSRARAGDRAALGELLSANREAVFAMSMRILRDRDEALDATQEALIKVVRYLGSFRPGEPFGPWLRRVALRAALDQAARRRRHPLSDGEPDRARASGPDPHQAAASAELARRVEEALDLLSAAQRAAFVCKQLEGLSTAQTARAMGCSRGTVRWHLFEARRRLAEALAEGGDR